MSEQAEGGEETPEPAAGSTEQSEKPPADSASVHSEVPPPISVTGAPQDANNTSGVQQLPAASGEKLSATGSEGGGEGASLPKRDSGVVTGPVLDLDAIITKLLAYKDRPGKQVNIPENQIRQLCAKARDLLLTQPVLLELSAPIVICGDLHGQYEDLLRLFDKVGYPPENNFLFLGDYVDRGKMSLETVSLVLAYKLKYPENFFLLRGNHECASINRIYGFYDECKRRYSIRLWKTFTDCFNCLPILAVVEDIIMCMHGGLSPDLKSLDQVREIERPLEINDRGLICDLLWSDPDDDILGWGENDRGVSYTFGRDIVQDMSQALNINLICRAHQVVEDGYQFFQRRQLVTVFSATNYCGEFDNAGSCLKVSKDLVCSFAVIPPQPPTQVQNSKTK